LPTDRSRRCRACIRFAGLPTEHLHWHSPCIRFARFPTYRQQRFPAPQTLSRGAHGSPTPIYPPPTRTWPSGASLEEEGRGAGTKWWPIGLGGGQRIRIFKRLLPTPGPVAHIALPSRIYTWQPAHLLKQTKPPAVATPDLPARCIETTPQQKAKKKTTALTRRSFALARRCRCRRR
jgi:hypothetical protein